MHVTPNIEAELLAGLSVSDRLDLMDEIEASLLTKANDIPLPEWHRIETEHRM